MKKTKLLHIITTLELGGAQKQALSLISSIDSQVYEKHFISSPSGELQQECLNLSNVKVKMLPALKRRISLWYDLLSLIQLLKYIKKHSIDIVHTHSSKAGILGRWAAHIAGTPVIVHTIHGWSFHEYLPTFLKYFYIWLERVTAKITTCFIAVSFHDIQKGIHSKIGKKEQYNLIRYGLADFHADLNNNKLEAKKNLGISQNRFCVGMVACLKPQKNPLDFIRLAENILAKRQDVDFICVGDGVLRTCMEKLIMEKNLTSRIKLFGWRKDIRNIIPAIDIMVLTSLWEGLPIALLEAMAHAVPVIVYNCDGIAEIVRDKVNGYLIKPRDVKSLTDKVESLLEDSSVANQLGENGRKIFMQQEFKFEYMLQSIEELYKKHLQADKAKH